MVLGVGEVNGLVTTGTGETGYQHGTKGTGGEEGWVGGLS